MRNGGGLFHLQRQLVIEEYLENKVPVKIVSEKYIPSAKAKNRFLVITPSIKIYGGNSSFNYLNHLDECESYTIAKAGFREFLGHLIKLQRVGLHATRGTQITQTLMTNTTASKCKRDESTSSILARMETSMSRGRRGRILKQL